MKCHKVKNRVFYSIWLKLIIIFILILSPVYFLGGMIFHRTYLEMQRQTVNSQTAQLNLYAGTINEELSRIRSLAYHCANDDDLIYLANAYDIMNTFDRYRYVLRAQHRIQVMKSSSICIDRVVLHLPIIGKSIDTRSIEPLAPNWKRKYNNFSIPLSLGLTMNPSHELEMNIQYPLNLNKNRDPSLAITLTLSNKTIQKLLQGFGNNQDTGLILKSTDNRFIIEKTNNKLFINHSLLKSPNKFPFTEEITIDGNHFQTTGVLLPESNLVLISFSSTEYLFGFGRTYLIMLIVLGIIAFLAMGAFAFSVHHLIHKPIQILVDSFKCMKKNDFKVRIHKHQNDEFAYLYESFNEMMDHLQRLIARVYEQQLLTQRAELKQLQAQINPHFLYNGFYNIYRMAQSDGSNKIAEFSQLLSEYYQYITRNSADLVTIKQEIGHATAYLKIQQIRFSNRLSIYIGEVPENFDSLLVPRLILQPLLENSFEHGLKNILEPKLSITFKKQDNTWMVQVEDNGTEFKESDLNNLKESLDSNDNGIETTALINIHRRLRYNFGSESGLRISQTPEGGMRVQVYIVKGD